MHKGPEESISEEKPIYRFLALKGGGSRGFIHLGVAVALIKLGVLDDIDMVAGSSAGAIAALLISTGWPLEKIIKELDALDLQSAIYQEWSFFAPFHLHWYLGLHSGDKLTEWFKKIIKEVTGDENATFLDWHEKKMALDREESSQHMKHLYVEACNIETGFNEEFSHTSVHKDVSIAEALSASMAYPGYFTPKIINGNKYSDGGLQSDCPISLFEHNQGQANPKMLAVWMDSLDRLKYILKGEQPQSMKVETLSQLAYANAVALYNVQLRHLLRSPYKDKLIYCDTLDISTLEFSLTSLQKSRLIESGYYGTVRFFLQHHPAYTTQIFDTQLLKQMIRMDYPISIEEFTKDPIIVGFENPKSSELPSLSQSEGLYKAWCYLPKFSAENIQPPLADSQKFFSFSNQQIDSISEELQEDPQTPTEPTKQYGWCRFM